MKNKIANLAGSSFMFALLMQTPAFAESLVTEGSRFYQEGNFGKAAQCFEKELQINQNNPEAHYYMGNIYCEFQRYAEAAKEYRLAVSMEPNGPITEYCKKRSKELTERAVVVPMRHQIICRLVLSIRQLRRTMQKGNGALDIRNGAFNNRNRAFNILSGPFNAPFDNIHRSRNRFPFHNNQQCKVISRSRGRGSTKFRQQNFDTN